MSTFILTLTSPDYYGVDQFTTDGSIWAETDGSKTKTTRYTGDAERPSVMAVQGNIWTLGEGVTLGDSRALGDSIVAQGEGAYKEYAVTPGSVYTLSCYYRCYNGVTGQLIVYDQTNSAVIASYDLTLSAWTPIESLLIAPGGCSAIRIKFVQKTGTYPSGPILVDNVALNESAIIYDPDEYTRRPLVVSDTHNVLSGNTVIDQYGVNYVLTLTWNWTTKAQYDLLYAFLTSGDIIYLDDGEVPPITESHIIYDTGEVDYSGITNPSTTQIAYKDSSPNLPSGEMDFNTTEYTTGEYQAIDEEDANYCETTNPAAGAYLYHRFELDAGIPQADVQRIGIKVVCSSDDASIYNTDGVVLYAWNDTDGAWVQIGRTTNSSKQSVVFNSTDTTIARQFIDSATGYVKLLLRSRGARYSTSSLSLRTYFIKVSINEGLDTVIVLSHRAVLDPITLDVLYVKNITTNTVLELTTDYTINADRRSINIIGQNSGDEIEVKYNRHWETVCVSLPEEFLDGDIDSDRVRKLTMVLQTVSVTPIT